MRPSKKVKRIRDNRQRLLKLQVREYNERYHPGLKDAIIEISPCGNFATVSKTGASAQKRGKALPTAKLLRRRNVSRREP